MIPLQKLATLPRSQRLRKTASIIRNAEHRLVVTGKLFPEETDYLEKLILYLPGDIIFPEPAAMALEKIKLNMLSESGKKEFRRSLNTVYHILQTETGRYQADWDFIEQSGALDVSKRNPFPGMQVYLDEIRSPFNVGSMFRAAESFGAEKIWLSPLCADPRHKRAERTAMGCVDVLPWERIGFNSLSGPFFALETGGIPLADFNFPLKGIMIAGSEELGVSPEALAAADASLGRVSIPGYGVKASLNVSVAFGIVMQCWSAFLHNCK